jgi:hypothetical protein
MNNTTFEDRERTLESFFCNTLYFWTTAFVYSLVISYHNIYIYF